jgi:D-alanine-D-alanine ligase
MRIAFCYNVKNSAPSTDPSKQVDTEFDAPSVINGIADTIKELGHTVVMVEATPDAFDKLKELKNSIDIVFNIAEGLEGDARESQIPMFCEVLGIPYTHSSPTTHAIKLDKEFTKLIVKGAGITNVPGNTKFPLIVKPNKEGSSKGIMDDSIVHNQEELDRKTKQIRDEMGVEVLAEEYIEGREFTVAVIGNENPVVLPIIEQKFDFLPSGMNKIASYELKWIYEDKLKDIREAYDCPAKLEKSIEDEIVRVSKAIYTLLDVRDCARLDYRLDKDKNLYFIEINTLPGMMPPAQNELSYFPLAAYTAGMTYKDLVGKIISFACERYGIKE